MTATTGTITNLQETVFGDKRIVIFDFALGTYASGGIALGPADVGLNKFDLVLVAPKSGYSYTYDSTNKKVIAFRSPASTSTGVITAPISVSQGSVTLTGPASAGTVLLQLTTDTATGILSKTTATTRTIPPSTFGIPAPTATITPTFVGGTSTTAVLSEVTGTPSLSTATRIMVIGV